MHAECSIRAPLQCVRALIHVVYRMDLDQNLIEELHYVVSSVNDHLRQNHTIFTLFSNGNSSTCKRLERGACSTLAALFLWIFYPYSTASCFVTIRVLNFVLMVCSALQTPPWGEKLLPLLLKRSSHWQVLKYSAHCETVGKKISRRWI